MDVTKKEKTGPDSRTKKQRRAVKVQEKQQGVAPVVAAKGPVAQADEKQKDLVTKDSPVRVLPTEQVSSNGAGKISQGSQLTEKQLRKLEWEKKLAEQKQNEEAANSKDVSKADIRNKRREQQEAQRLAKANAKSETTKKPAAKPTATKPAAATGEQTKKVSSRVAEDVSRSGQQKQAKKSSEQTVKSPVLNSVNLKTVHPAFIVLGSQQASRKIMGSTARCLSLMAALKHLVEDIETPPHLEFCRYLEVVLQDCVTYLESCRHFSFSMNNALRTFKGNLEDAAKEPDNASKKEFLLDKIRDYMKDNILKANDSIIIKLSDRIEEGDKIVTLGGSPSVTQILIKAARENKRFEVYVVDNRPFSEGRQMLKRLRSAGISCRYAEITAVQYAMAWATKVMLGADALLGNGYVMSRVGFSHIAYMAQKHSRPILVCCEIYKFSEKTMMDALALNEFCDSQLLKVVDTLEDQTPIKYSEVLNALNIIYDVTPSSLISFMFTEWELVPCTSVPGVLKRKLFITDVYFNRQFFFM